MKASKNTILAWGIGGGIVALIGIYMAHDKFKTGEEMIKVGGAQGAVGAVEAAGSAVAWSVVAALAGASALYAVGTNETPVEAVTGLVKRYV